MENNVLGFLKDKNIRHIQKGADLLVSCFNKRDHKRGDINPSLGVDGYSGVFYCWSCHVKGIFPQLIAAFGYVNEVSRYCSQPITQRIIYDIDSLKSGSAVSIPGIGRFVEKPQKNVSNAREYIESRKVTLSGSAQELSDKIIHDSSHDPGIRVQYMQETEINDSVGMEIPKQLVKAKYVEYFSERGLPSCFCDHHDIYLADKYHPLPEYKTFLSPKYFYVPVRGHSNQVKSLLGVSFQKDTDPRMYYVGPRISYPILDLEKLRFDQDLYVVEGWLDHYKLQTMGFNSFPTLSNIFNFFHYTLLSRVHHEKKVFFVFDQDVAGYQMLKRIIPYVSRTTKNWIAVFLPHARYKDVGDIELLDISKELSLSKKYALPQIKKYLVMLGMEKYNDSKEVFSTDRYTLRSDSVFQEFGIEHFGSGDKNPSETSSGIWEELPVEKGRKNESCGAGRLVPI